MGHDEVLKIMRYWKSIQGVDNAKRNDAWEQIKIKVDMFRKLVGYKIYLMSYSVIGFYSYEETSIPQQLL